jgi:hypothetical protein
MELGNAEIECNVHHGIAIFRLKQKEAIPKSNSPSTSNVVAQSESRLEVAGVRDAVEERKIHVELSVVLSLGQF